MTCSSSGFAPLPRLAAPAFPAHLTAGGLEFVIAGVRPDAASQLPFFPRVYGPDQDSSNECCSEHIELHRLAFHLSRQGYSWIAS